MVNAFLYQITKHYVSDYDGDLKDVCFVFPSRRSSLFFRKYLGLCSSGPLFSPELLTISDLFDLLSPYRRADRIELVSILYKHYLELTAANGLVCDSFDEFVYKADTLLSDFNDIDKYLVDAGDLFANVRDLESISAGYDYLSEAQKEAIRNFWKITLDNSSDRPGKMKFLQIWNVLAPLYEVFRTDLAAKGIAYEGMMTRTVAEMIRDHADGIDGALAKYERIVFVGHNALSSCEQILFNYIRNSGKGDFYWDFKGKLLRDADNKASRFIASYESEYPSRYRMEDESAGPQEIEVVSVPSAVGQAKKTADYLREMDPDSTAIVLPDGSLLMPLLNSVPEEIRKINVTMGYGLSNSAFAALISSMGPLQLNRRTWNGEASFYHKDVTAVLTHPLVMNACPEEVRKIRTEMNLNNLVQVPVSRLCDGQPELLKAIFRPVVNVDEVYEWQLNLIEMLAGHISDLEKEFAYGYYKAVSHIRDLKIPYLDKLDTYFHFLRQITSGLNVPFRGEPLQGLQIMGPLETRALDFENLIILSVNEGTFPAKNDTDSYIPYSLRKAFGLPTFELFDSISAYHFYRSIYRARKVVLMYDSRTFGTHSGEPSRFIMQLKHHYKNDVRLVEKVCTYTINPSKQGKTSVVKDEEVMRQLRQVFLDDGHSFSASGLNTYMDCPMQFYYTRVKGIRESDKIDEQFESAPFGTAFHEIMETLYGQYKNEIISPEIIGRILDGKEALDSLIREKLDKNLKYHGMPITGKRLVTFEMLKRIVEHTLEYDKDYAPFVYLDGERQIYANLEAGGVKVKLNGIIDRLDSREGRIRIVDYKTGGAKLHNKKDFGDAVIDAMFDINDNNRPATSFQMYLYAYLMSRYRNHTLNRNGLENAPVEDMDICVYQLKEMFKSALSTFSSDEDMLKTFEDRLRKLVAEIFAEGEFAARPDIRRCDYCPVRVLCSY